MWALLERWRGKDREARTRAALILASCITGIIAVVWLASLPARFTQTSEQAANALGSLGSEPAVSDAEHTLQELVSGAEALRDQVQAAVSTTTASTSESVPAIPRRVLIATTTMATTTGEIRQ